MNYPCFECDTNMVETTTSISGIEVTCYRCPKCKSKVFSEEQAFAAARKIDAIKMLDWYRKPIMEIGGSLAVTIPKPVADAFHLKGKNVRIKPLLSKGKIEISVME
ncbi:MAG: hypothetical protein AABX47_02735 [Nanoarchaeota archaeon]